jgi:outer membrane lipoprotein SlyB
MNGTLKSRSGCPPYEGDDRGAVRARQNGTLTMNRNSMLRCAATAVMLAAVALPGLASAQSYDDRRNDSNNYGYGQTYDYRRCDTRDRQATGAVIGATLGAVAGSQMSARGRRTENSVLGGLLGAVIGASVAGDSANCGGQTGYGYDQRTYDHREYDQRGYDQSGAYGYDGYERDRRYDGRRHDDRAYDAYGYDRDGCRVVETRRRDRYGREVTRYEQVCRQGY